ncbi:MAG: hypothetical protein R6W89_06570 [Candidatus Hydrogenedentota bacterium]
MFVRRGAIVIAALAVLLTAPSAGADSIELTNGETRQNVIVREGANLYYVQNPASGEVDTFRVNEVESVTTADHAERDALVAKWERNHATQQDTQSEATPTQSIAEPSTGEETPSGESTEWITNLDDNTADRQSEAGISRATAQQMTAAFGYGGGATGGFGGTSGGFGGGIGGTTGGFGGTTGGFGGTTGGFGGTTGGFGGTTGGFGGTTGGFGGQAGGFGGQAGGFGGAGGGFGGAGGHFSNISQLFTNIDDRLVGEPPAVIMPMSQTFVQGPPRGRFLGFTDLGGARGSGVAAGQWRQQFGAGGGMGAAGGPGGVGRY